MADNPAYDGETMKDKEKVEPHGNFDVPGEKGGGGTAGFLSVGNSPISLSSCTQNSDWIWMVHDNSFDEKPMDFYSL